MSFRLQHHHILQAYFLFVHCYPILLHQTLKLSNKSQKYKELKKQLLLGDMQTKHSCLNAIYGPVILRKSPLGIKLHGHTEETR